MRFSMKHVVAGMMLALAGCEGGDEIHVTPDVAVPPKHTTSASPTTTTTRPRPKNNQPEPPFWAELVEKGSLKPDRAVARVLQVMDEFDHPSSVVATPDGNTLYVANTAQSSAGAQMNKGSISRLTIDNDGRLKMEKAKWVEGLHLPMGLTVMTKGTKKFPVGTLVVTNGATTGVDANGDQVQDIKKFTPRITFLDPVNGQVLGHIPLGEGTPVAKSVYHPVLSPCGLTFDQDGHLFVADTGNTGKTLDPEVSTRPGIIRIRYANIDEFADGKSDGNVSYVPVRHEPAAIYHCPLDDGLYWTTSDGRGPAGGAVYRIPRTLFPQQNMINNAIGDVGPLMGVTITPRGTMIMSRIEGDLAFINQSKIAFIPFNSQFSFNSPGDIKMLNFRNGNNILYVPETDPASSESWKQRLWVILLPAAL